MGGGLGRRAPPNLGTGFKWNVGLRQNYFYSLGPSPELHSTAHLQGKQ